MNTFSVKDAGPQLAEILGRAESGETIVFTRDNISIAEIRPLRKKPIRLGAFSGEFEIPESAFAPLTTEEMKEWYGE